MQTVREFTVFLASPSDADQERKEVRAAVEKLNGFLISNKQRVRLRAKGWEEAAASLNPGGPQAVINERLEPETSDFVIGVFRERFGTTTKDGMSGTEEEIRRAYSAWLASNHTSPQISLYFYAEPVSGSLDQHDQIGRVLRFKKEFRGAGIIHDYSNVVDFRHKVEADLWDRLQFVLERQQELSRQIDLKVSSNVVRVRAEGVAEPLSAVQLRIERKASDGSPEIFVYDIDLYTTPTINFTSRLIGIDQFVCSLLSSGEPDDPPVLGRLIGPNAIRFDRVILPPGRRIYNLAINGLRVNASQLGVPIGGVGDVGIAVVPKPVGESTPPLVLQMSRVGAAVNSLEFRVLPGGGSERYSVSSQVGINGDHTDEAIETGGCDPSFLLVFTELFPGVLRTHGEEGQGTNRLAQRTTSAADPSNGCRLIVRFSNIPQGIDLFIATSSHTSPAGSSFLRKKALLVVDADPNGAGGEVAKAENLPSFLRATIDRGSSYVVWEGTGDAMGAHPDKFAFGVVVRAKPGSAALGIVSVNGNAAPLSPVATASVTAVIPRFVDGAVNRTALEVLP